MFGGLLTRKEQLILIFLVCALLVGSGTLWWNRHRASRIGIVNDQPGGETVLEETSASQTTPQPAADVELLPSQASAPTVAQTQGATEQPSRGQVTVNVAGAVVNPDVVKLPAGSIVEDAVNASGGYRADADPTGINRAAKLIDGTTLNVPAKPTIQTGRDAQPVLRMPSPARNIPEYLPGYVPPPEQPKEGAVGVVSVPVQPQAQSRKININTATSEELQTLPGIGPKLATALIEYRSRQPFHNIEEIQDVPQIGSKRFAQIKDLITVSGE